nr:cbb3-type cytochrome c oxidase subunit I [Candidatus Brachybacter algidus]
MKYKTQKLAYWFFALSMLLLTLQLVYGFIMGFARIDMQGLHDIIPFNVARAVHTNLLVMWLLSGFMGAAYYIIPEEAEHELVAEKLGYIQLISFALVGVAAIVGFHFNIWEEENS